jgi:hypothetical protein
MSRTDTAQLTTLRTEVLIWRALETAIRRRSRSTHPPDRRHLQRAHRHAPARAGRGAQRHCGGFGSLLNVKNVFVVDPDIDIFPTSRWNGRSPLASSPIATRGRERVPHHSA